MRAQQAFDAYRLSNPQKAVQCADWCVDHYCMSSNFNQAAKLKEKAGAVIEEVIGDNKKACEYYETAAEWYDGKGSSA